MQKRGDYKSLTSVLLQSKSVVELDLHPFLECSRFCIPPVRGNMLGWYDSFTGKKRKKAWRAAPLCLSWNVRGCDRSKVIKALIKP